MRYKLGTQKVVKVRGSRLYTYDINGRVVHNVFEDTLLPNSYEYDNDKLVRIIYRHNDMQHWDVIYDDDNIIKLVPNTPSLTTFNVSYDDDIVYVTFTYAENKYNISTLSNEDTTNTHICEYIKVLKYNKFDPVTMFLI